jgi:hypothetical protein
MVFLESNITSLILVNTIRLFITLKQALINRVRVSIFDQLPPVLALPLHAEIRLGPFHIGVPVVGVEARICGT